MVGNLYQTVLSHTVSSRHYFIVHLVHKLKDILVKQSNIQKYVRQLNFSKTHSLVNIPNVNQSISCDSLFNKDLTIEFNFIFKIVSIKMKAFKYLTNIAL